VLSLFGHPLSLSASARAGCHAAADPGGLCFFGPVFRVLKTAVRYRLAAPNSKKNRRVVLNTVELVEIILY
jgi:hypothetical protein